MKKSLLVLMSLVGIAGGLTLASCQNADKSQAKEVISFNDMYSTSAITGISVLNSNGPVRKAKALTEDDKNKVIENYKLVEGLISDGITKTEETASDRAEFEKMYSITITNLDGSKETYKYYYTELSKPAEKEDDEDKDDKKDSLEIEVESHLKGIVIMNDKEYQMDGKKELETEGNETEVEFTFNVVDPETQERVLIKQESETEDNETEEEFKYIKFDKNGRKIYEKELEIENENGKLEYELVERNNGVRKSYEYEIKTAADGSKYVEAKIIEGKDVIRAEFKAVTDAEGNVSYEFIEK